MIVAILAALAATAAPAPAVCAALTDQIDSALKETSSNEAADVTDDSAPRQTSRNAANTAKLAEVQSNIALMSAHHCAPYASPINLRAYFSAAFHCSVTMSADVRSASYVPGHPGDSAKAACDRSTWKRAGE